MNDMNNFEERGLRQRDILPPDRLADCTATVIGVGAIGRQVALQLAAIGIPRMQLIDHDAVEPVNLSAQGYLERDVAGLRWRLQVICARDSTRASHSNCITSAFDEACPSATLSSAAWTQLRRGDSSGMPLGRRLSSSATAEWPPRRCAS